MDWAELIATESHEVLLFGQRAEHQLALESGY